MSRLAFPAVVEPQEKRNLEGIEYKEQVRFVFFSFNISIYKVSKLVVKLPANSLIWVPISIRVVEAFNTLPLVFNLSTVEAIDDVAIFNIGQVGVFSFWSGPRTKAMEEFKKPTEIVMSITGTSQPTQGSGTGILPWLNLNHIPRV